MMYPKRRKIPIQVSVWTQQDVTVRKPTISSGLMPDDTRYNVFCRRKFHDDLLNLSFERHRNIIRRDFSTKTFLKKQRQKAEKSMPGLLPYIEPFKEETEDLSLSKLSVRRISLLTSKPSIKPVSPNGGRLSKLANQQSNIISSVASTKEYFHSRNTKKELLHNIDRESNYNSYLPKLNNNNNEDSSRDRRFQRLIYLFSDVHERELNKDQSVESIIQSNPALQDHSERSDRWKTTKLPSFEVHEEREPSDIDLRSESLGSEKGDDDFF